MSRILACVFIPLVLFSNDARCLQVDVTKISAQIESHMNTNLGVRFMQVNTFLNNFNVEFEMNHQLSMQMIRS